MIQLFSGKLQAMTIIHLHLISDRRTVLLRPQELLMMFMLRIKYLHTPVTSMKLILLHRLGGKPIFKEGRMLDTWA